jgi:hypothetical protein
MKQVPQGRTFTKRRILTDDLVNTGGAHAHRERR